jgi:hypothetical protein
MTTPETFKILIDALQLIFTLFEILEKLKLL